LGVKGKNKVIKYVQLTISWNEFWTDFRNFDHVTHGVEGGATPERSPVTANTKAVDNLPSGASTIGNGPNAVVVR
jgi:hypothetical protein